MMIRISKCPTAADRHEARVPDLREDHGWHSFCLRPHNTQGRTHDQAHPRGKPAKPVVESASSSRSPSRQLGALLVALSCGGGCLDQRRVRVLAARAPSVTSAATVQGHAHERDQGDVQQRDRFPAYFVIAYRTCVAYGELTALTTSRSTSWSNPSNSRLPAPRITGAVESTSSSTRPAASACRITSAPPPIATSSPPAFSVACASASSSPDTNVNPASGAGWSPVR